MLYPSVSGFYVTDYCDSAVTDLDATKRKRMFVVDSGLLFNSPYPPLLRPQRGVDLYISFDFSARKKDLTENPLKVLSSSISDLKQLRRERQKRQLKGGSRGVERVTNPPPPPPHTHTHTHTLN